MTSRGFAQDSKLTAIQDMVNRLKEIKEPQYRVWVPKAIAVASALPFYDFFNTILEDLLQRMQSETKVLFE
jgi:hypothetical protein